jgi:ADP-ribose pyrophosphatase YjhB (NUDIX family)
MKHAYTLHNSSHTENAPISTCCNNCGKSGHYYYQCKLPITSYGIIAFKMVHGEPHFLMIRRKNTFGFIDFIRGKYNCNNVHQLQNIVDQMSIEEKDKILNQSFNTLWADMWGSSNNGIYRSEEVNSSKKFDILKNGGTYKKHNDVHELHIDVSHGGNDDSLTDCYEKNTAIVSLESIVCQSETNWTEPEWEFPKGRKNSREKDIECALREFEEETGIPKERIDVIQNAYPFEEIFIGTNYKCYKNKYFLGYYNFNSKKECAKWDNNSFQKEEVSKMEWVNLKDVIKNIRPYNLEKIHLINSVNEVINRYRLYS